MDYLDKYINSEEYERTAQQERLIIQVAEHISDEVRKQHTTLEKIGKAIGKTKSWVCQRLGGDSNMTLKSLSDIAFALNKEVEVKLRDRNYAWVYVPESNKVTNYKPSPQRGKSSLLIDAGSTYWREDKEAA